MRPATGSRATPRWRSSSERSRVRSPSHRAVLLAALATPAGAAVLAVGITRVLAFVVPVAVLAALGLDLVLSWLAGRLGDRTLAAATLAVLSAGAVGLLVTALANGPYWSKNYGLYGMQWGAEQLFVDHIPRLLARDPRNVVLVSHSWANDPDVFLGFFLSPEQRARVRMQAVDIFLDRRGQPTDNTLLIMTPEEYERAQSSPKIRSVEVDETVPYPDGSPGFFVARVAYVPDVDALFAAEREERRAPVEEQVLIGDQMVGIRHSRFDMGEIKNLFDGDRFTLARVMEANPAVIELLLPEPRVLSGVGADFGSHDLELTFDLALDGTADRVTYVATFRDQPPDPHVEVLFDRGPHVVTALRLSIRDLKAGDRAKIHIRELTLRP